jgi:hypothetical protein
MNASPSVPGRDVLALRWAARALSVVLFLLWGAFFVEHLREWFADPAHLPPPYVFAMQGLHGLFLLGLLVGWRWELLGAGMILAAAVPFFWFAAGSNFLLFASVTCLPAVLWLYCATREGLAKPRSRPREA